MCSAVLRTTHNHLYDRRDTEFVLHELGGIPKDDTVAIIDSCESFVDAWHHVDPLLDRSPPQLVPGSETADGRARVVSNPITKDFINAYREMGFAEMSELDLPFAVQCAAQFTLGGAASSNLLGYFVLTRCAADLLEAHGSPALKEEYLPKLRSAEWFGARWPRGSPTCHAARTLATPTRHCICAP